MVKALPIFGVFFGNFQLNWKFQLEFTDTDTDETIKILIFYFSDRKDTSNMWRVSEIFLIKLKFSIRLYNSTYSIHKVWPMDWVRRYILESNIIDHFSMSLLIIVWYIRIYQWNKKLSMIFRVFFNLL